MAQPMIVLIAGPTASGKSALAVALAQQLGGVVINADSMQIFAGLPILTAQPQQAELASAPHCLYGHVPPAAGYSVSLWLADVAHVLSTLAAANQPAMIVGGTGLYFRALTDGLSPVPEIPPEVRQRWRSVGLRVAPPDLHAELQKRDPIMAGRLRPSDPQRIIRALEVIEATGQSLAAWQSVPGKPLIDINNVRRIVVAPPRDVLRTRCDERFEAMLSAGALDEVRAFSQLGVPAAAPIMGALGVVPLLAHLAGSLTLDAAATVSKAATRQYAKRQLTWARRFMSDWQWFDPVLDTSEVIVQGELSRNKRA
jgi:tRNA dimethylallyltransferase